MFVAYIFDYWLNKFIRLVRQISELMQMMAWMLARMGWPGSVNDLIRALARHQQERGAIAAAEEMLRINEPLPPDEDGPAHAAPRAEAHAAAMLSDRPPHTGNTGHTGQAPSHTGQAPGHAGAPVDSYMIWFPWRGCTERFFFYIIFP